MYFRGYVKKYKQFFISTQYITNFLIKNSYFWIRNNFKNL